MEDFLIVLLIVAIILVLNYFIAKEFENIAERKGAYGKPYFWWSFLLGSVGWLMVIALPDRYEQQKNNTLVQSPKEESNYFSNLEAEAAKVSDSPETKVWYCRKCGDKNVYSASACKGCGAYR